MDFTYLYPRAVGIGLFFVFSFKMCMYFHLSAEGGRGAAIEIRARPRAGTADIIVCCASMIEQKKELYLFISLLTARSP